MTMKSIKNIRLDVHELENILSVIYPNLEIIKLLSTNIDIENSVDIILDQFQKLKKILNIEVN